MALDKKSKMAYLIKNMTHEAAIELFKYIRQCSIYTQKEIYEHAKAYIRDYEESGTDDEWNRLFHDEVTPLEPPV